MSLSLVQRSNQCVTHCIDARELQCGKDNDDGEELPADCLGLNQLQHWVAANTLQGGSLLQHLCYLPAVVLVAPELFQNYTDSSCYNTTQYHLRKETNKCFPPTPASQACWSPLYINRKLGDSGRKGSVRSWNNAVKPLKPSSQGQAFSVPSSSLQVQHYFTWNDDQHVMSHSLPNGAVFMLASDNFQPFYENLANVGSNGLHVPALLN